MADGRRAVLTAVANICVLLRVEVLTSLRVTRAAMWPPRHVRDTDGPLLLALGWGGLQRQAAWRRDGEGAGAGPAPRAVSSPGSDTRAPSSWSVSASLRRYMHAQGQRRPGQAPGLGQARPADTRAPA